MLSDIRVFNARFVNEIRNENTKKTYKKSRLIIQTYNNSKKNQIFIQLLHVGMVWVGLGFEIENPIHEKCKLIELSSNLM